MTLSSTFHTDQATLARPWYNEYVAPPQQEDVPARLWSLDSCAA
jgi:hypothetical protein